MPELPEVETVVRQLRGELLGRQIIDVHTAWPRHIDRPDWEQFQSRLLGRTIANIYRRGKYIVIGLDGDEYLIIHLKMSGQLLVTDAEQAYSKHDHTIFSLEDSRELRFRDTRKFGRIYLTDSRQEILGKLGPEPLSEEFTLELFQDMLSKKRRILKPLLLDQTFVAGIGNIYADEALHYARLDPRRLSNSLTRSETKALFNGVQTALRAGIMREGASIDVYRKPNGSKGFMQNALVVYGNAGEDCPRCSGTIDRIVLGGRSTHYCPGCQR
jgi:formamidopyrimidine-DNA glycosylase